MRFRFYTPFEIIELSLPECAERSDVVRKALEIGAVMYTPLEESHADCGGVGSVPCWGLGGVRPVRGAADGE